MELEALFDRVEELRTAGDLDPVALPEEAAADPVTGRFAALLADRHLRPDHRARIYEDLHRHRDLFLKERDGRMAELVYWSEQVERLYTSLRQGRLETFHYVRALEATCRRCGFDLLPVMGRMEELGKVWGGRDFAATHALLSTDLVKVDPPGEPPDELRPQE